MSIVNVLFLLVGILIGSFLPNWFTRIYLKNKNTLDTLNFVNRQQGKDEIK